MNRKDRALFSIVPGSVRPRQLTRSMGMPRYELERRSAQSEVIDVLTIGDEGRVHRPVQRALRGGWVIRQAGTLDALVRLLRTERAAVAVLEGDDHWVDLLTAIRYVSNSPEVIVATEKDLPVENVLGLGAHDVLGRPMSSTDLLWSIATAWHAWMKRFQSREGYG